VTQELNIRKKNIPSASTSDRTAEINVFDQQETLKGAHLIHRYDLL
jgi:hypothetical protein